MLPHGNTYDEVVAGFNWAIPNRYNIGVDVCDRWAKAEPNRVAIVHVGEHHTRRSVTFRELAAETNRLANAWAAQGISRGDRVGVLLPQAPETAIAHIAAYKMGAI